jgi:hypothetical protein
LGQHNTGYTSLYYINQVSACRLITFQYKMVLKQEPSIHLNGGHLHPYQDIHLMNSR